MFKAKKIFGHTKDDKMHRIFQFILIVWVLCPLNLWALVDYTEQEYEKVPQIQTSSGNPKPMSVNTTSISSKQNGGNFISAFSLGNSFESQKININEQTKKVDKYNFNLFIQSGYNIFMNANFWMAKTDSEMISSNAKTQNGNPTIKLGFNWLRFGNQTELATVDIFGGMMLKGHSDFASSRNDQLLGIETTKRFHQMAFGLGYEYRITGDPANPVETMVGNISKFQVAMGWKVSGDINLSLEANYIKVQGTDSPLKESLLYKGFNYGYVTPKMSLALSQLVGIDLGGNFRTKKVLIDESILQAHLWELQGLYGNSIFAGLNILW